MIHKQVFGRPPSFWNMKPCQWVIVFQCFIGTRDPLDP